MLNLAEQGVLSVLILAQDDWQAFGLPNITKQRFFNYINKKKLTDRVFVTRGADEVALTILGHILTELSGKPPKIYVKYSAPEVLQIIMPYMPHTVAQTVQEKIAIAGGSIVDKLEIADFILYIHVGTAKTAFNTLRKSARDVNALIASGHKVALVDLSERFYFSDTLLPILLRENTPLINLAAYVGWNATSNSIGSAITEASILTQQAKLGLSMDYVVDCHMVNA